MENFPGEFSNKFYTNPFFFGFLNHFAHTQIRVSRSSQCPATRPRPLHSLKDLAYVNSPVPMLTL